MLTAVVVTPVVVVAIVTYWDEVAELAGAQPDVVLRIPPSTTATASVPNSVIDLSQPFVGTPAAGWKNGTAGITAPKPKDVGQFSAKQVSDAVKQVTRHLDAAYFNRRVIEEHDVEPLLNTLAPDARPEVRSQFKDPQAATAYTVLIHQDYPLLPASPKAKVKLSVRPGTEPGELIVKAKFAVAYAFDTDRPDRLLGSLDLVSVVRMDMEFVAVSGPAWPQSARGIWHNGGKGFTYSMNCDEFTKGYLAPAYSERRWDGPEPQHDVQYYFDPDKPAKINEDCATS